MAVEHKSNGSQLLAGRGYSVAEAYHVASPDETCEHSKIQDTITIYNKRDYFPTCGSLVGTKRSCHPMCCICVFLKRDRREG